MKKIKSEIWEDCNRFVESGKGITIINPAKPEEPKMKSKTAKAKKTRAVKETASKKYKDFDEYICDLILAEENHPETREERDARLKAEKKKSRR